MIHTATIPGIPIGKGRPRSALRKTTKGKTFIHHYTPEKTRSWESMAAFYLMRYTEKMVGPLKLQYVAIFPRPQRMLTNKWPNRREPHTDKPDVDNIAKALMDAIVNSGLVADDAQFVALEGAKLYADRIEDPHITCIISSYSNPVLQGPQSP